MDNGHYIFLHANYQYNVAADSKSVATKGSLYTSTAFVECQTKLDVSLTIYMTVSGDHGYQSMPKYESSQLPSEGGIISAFTFRRTATLLHARPLCQTCSSEGVPLLFLVVVQESQCDVFHVMVQRYAYSAYLPQS